MLRVWSLVGSVRRAGRVSRWAGVLVVLIVAGGVGSAATAIAAARTTASAYPRALERLDAPDLIVDFGLLDTDDPAAVLDEIDRVPGVVDRTDSAALGITKFDGPVPDFSFPENVVASVEGRRFYETDKVTVLQGRMPDRRSAVEVLANRRFADEVGVEVGDRLDLGVVLYEEASALFDPTLPPAQPEAVTFEVVGIGLLPEEAVEDDVAGKRLLVASPTAWQRWSGSEVFRRSGLVLEPGADIDRVANDIRAVLARHATERSYGPPQFEHRAELVARVQRGVRPYVIALAMVGVFLAVATVFIAGQLLARQVARTNDAARVLRAAGLRGRTIALVGALPSCATIAIGAVLGLLASVAAARSAPVGPVRDVADTTSPVIDWTVLAGTACAVVVLLAARTLAAAWSVVRQSRSRAERSRDRRGVSLPVLRPPLGASLGIRRAVGAWRGTGSAPRLAQSTVGVAVAAVAAVLAFGSGMSNLADDPRLFGNGWDAVVSVNGGYNPPDFEALLADDDVSSVAVASFANVSVNGVEVPLVGISDVHNGTTLLPPMHRGRPPRTTDEIALGASTLEALGVQVGDDVKVQLGGPAGELTMRVVGSGVLPAIGFSDADRAALGRGAVVTFRPEALGNPSHWITALVDLRPGADTEAFERRFADPTTNAEVYLGPRSADVASFGRLDGLVVLLVVWFSVVAAFALVHVAAQSATDGRREDAVLSALGVDGRVLRQIARSQARTVAVAALFVATPLGLAIGRAGWLALARDVGVLPAAPLPGWPVAALAAGAIVVATVAARALARVGRGATLEALRAD